MSHYTKQVKKFWRSSKGLDGAIPIYQQPLAVLNTLRSTTSPYKSVICIGETITGYHVLLNSSDTLTIHTCINGQIQIAFLLFLLPLNETSVFSPISIWFQLDCCKVCGCIHSILCLIAVCIRLQREITLRIQL